MPILLPWAVCWLPFNVPVANKCRAVSAIQLIAFHDSTYPGTIHNLTMTNKGVSMDLIRTSLARKIAAE
jgi:hypothetical protein